MIEEGVVYVVDYPLIHNLTNVADIGDINPTDERKMRRSMSPFGAFVSVEGNSGIHSLKAVAIQVDMNSGNRIPKLIKRESLLPHAQHHQSDIHE